MRVTLFALLLAILAVSTLAAPDYSTEINLPNETCSVNSSLSYYLTGNSLWSSDLNLHEIIFYSCCDSFLCHEYAVDQTDQKLPSADSLHELFWLQQVRMAMTAGSLSPTVFRLQGSSSFCEYFGIDTLRQESTNLLAEGANQVRPILAERRAIQISKGITAARSLGFIESVNPAALVTSVACYHDDKKVKQLATRLAECDRYITTLHNSVAVQGIALHIFNCRQELLPDLTAYTQSELATARGLLDSAINAVQYFFSMLLDPLDTSGNRQIQRSLYDQLLAIRSALEAHDMSYPEAWNQMSYQNSTMTLRRASIFTLLQSVDSKANTVKEKLSPWKRLPNILVEPNYNFARAKELASTADHLRADTHQHLDQGHFNSAVKNVPTIIQYYSEAEKVIDQEMAIQRKIDWRPFLASVLVVLLVVEMRRKKY